MREHVRTAQDAERTASDGVAQVILTVLAPVAFILILALFGQLGNLSFTTPMDDELTQIILSQ
jgi:hypothetical protein